MSRNKRRGSNRNQNDRKAKREKTEGQRNNDTGGWSSYKRENATFEEYYKAQNIVPEGEWDAFIAALKRPLPTTFRVTEGTPFTEEVKRKLKFFSEKPAVTLDDGVVVEATKNLEWYPNNGGWYYDISRHALKKAADLKDFTRFLQVQTDCGNISRQEAVSMIPPMLLNVEPHHKVLDMCAAPGSKTGQIIEFLHKDLPPGTLPSGCVIANDADFKRCYTLMHQIARLHSPSILVTNHEAQRFPWLKAQPETIGLTDQDVKEGVTKLGKVTVQFDRVLADVPCSGDGTMRKNPDIWDDWAVYKSLGIHKLQLSIAVRGANLLKVGGRMVYSTCSMSPSENEAVVAELLRQTKGALRILDVSNELPHLKRSPGLHTWKVQDKNGKWHESYEAIDDPELKKKIPSSVFPPKPEEAAAFNLERCLRLLPHQQDTGGFFVTVLEKVAPTWTTLFPEGEEKSEGAVDTKENVDKSAATDAANKEDAEKKSAKVAAKKAYPEAPFTVFEAEKQHSEQWNSIKSFYGIKDGFPIEQLMVRSENAGKISLVTKSLKQIWTADDRKDLKIVNGGVRILNIHECRDKLECAYRITHEGSHHMHAWVTKRLITVQTSDFSLLLREADPLFRTFSEKVANAMMVPSQGCVLLQIDPDTPKPWGGYHMAAWLAKVSCHFQVPKGDLESLKLLAKEYGLLEEKQEETEGKEEQVTEKKEEEKTEEKAETKVEA